MNQLASATSPYLRQHAENPVDWREWDADALAEAAARDVPILLSIGYAACHWCHVMAHESFEDEATAALMNDLFVCVKVDREERPDLDAVYMNATQAMTGQGGWPMTCFLTPAAEPFYCGTYYPKHSHGGLPSFTQLITAVAETWRERRGEVQEAADNVVAALRQQAAGLPDSELTVDAALLDHAVATVLRDEDTVCGGFGGAPKFPPSALLEALLRHYERTGSAQALDATMRTAEAMARGGIYDQLRGGFARYSVDAQWVVPHFEKMLYDNALLLRVYGHLARSTEFPLAGRIATETAWFLMQDLATGDGGFASALDADTHGIEGATYAWKPAELVGELGPDDGRWAAEVFGVTTAGTFEHGMSVLQLLVEPADAERFDRVRDAMRAIRDRRPQPARDDKVVTAWNGMAIVALAETGAALGHPEWVAAAARCARLLLDTHIVDGTVRRTSLGGVVGSATGVLEDYAWMASGLLALHQADGDVMWLDAAQKLLDTAIDRFADPETPGSWFDTAADAETLVARPRDPIDGATPSGAASLADALYTAARVSDPARATRYHGLADLTLDRAAAVVARAPRSAGHWLAVAEAAVSALEIAVVGKAGSEDFDELTAAARKLAPGGAVIVAGEPDAAPLLADRPLVNGRAAAYVCRASVCSLPLATPDALRGELR